MLTDQEKKNIKTLLDEYVEEKMIVKMVARWLYTDIIDCLRERKLEYTEAQ